MYLLVTTSEVGWSLVIILCLYCFYLLNQVNNPPNDKSGKGKGR